MGNAKKRKYKTGKSGVGPQPEKGSPTKMRMKGHPSINQSRQSEKIQFPCGRELDYLRIALLTYCC